MKADSILFIVDGTLNRPILHSQGIPHMLALSRAGYRCVILSFELPGMPLSVSLENTLREGGVKWEIVYAQTERAQMILKGYLHALKICRQEKINVVHCRSYRPAVIGALLKKLGGFNFIFDMRGFLIDEQLMLGRWREGSLKYRLARWMERICVLTAAAVVTNTEAFQKAVFALPYFPLDQQPKVVIIPNNVDTSRFVPSEEARGRIRREKNWGGRVVLTFSGEARAWEAFQEVIRFFRVAKKSIPSLYLAFFVYGDLKDLLDLLNNSGLDPQDYSVETVPPDRMGVTLAAADVGILLRRSNPFISKVSSPIKFAEYLACGLPVVVSQGIGDTETVINHYKAGVVLHSTSDDSLQQASQQLLELLNDRDTTRRCRNAAEIELDLNMAVDRYQGLYQEITSHRDGFNDRD